MFVFESCLAGHLSVCMLQDQNTGALDLLDVENPCTEKSAPLTLKGKTSTVLSLWLPSSTVFFSLEETLNYIRALLSGPYGGSTAFHFFRLRQHQGILLDPWAVR